MAFLMILLLIVFGWLLGGGAWDMVRHWFRHRKDDVEYREQPSGKRMVVVHPRNPVSPPDGFVWEEDFVPARQWDKARREAKTLRELAEFEMWFNKPAAPISGEDFMRGGHALNCQCKRCVENRECF